MKGSTFVFLIIAGIISATVAVLGPLHEVWHWLASVLSGTPGKMYWTEFYGTLNLLTTFAGMFGESITLTVLFLIFMRKRMYKIATYLFGYMAAFMMVVLASALGVQSIDLTTAYKYFDSGTVTFVYLMWVLMYLLLFLSQILTLIDKKRGLFGKNVDNKVIRV